MATGLLIRDFTKVYREVRYENQGSIRLSEIEHNAYLNRITLEVTHYDAYRSVSYKTIPDNTHWGYLTSFKGSSVWTNQAVKFAKQRVYEQINQGIWNYHNAQENIWVLSNLIVKLDNLLLGDLSSDPPGAGFIAITLLLLQGLENLTASAANWVVEQITDPGTIPTNATANYTAYPIVSPFPDVWKFKSDIPVSFLFRLESWYLVNPAVYITANPTDTSDETEDESEYPEPTQGDGDGDGAEFPPGSAPDPTSDPRDYDPLAASGTGVWRFTVEFSNPGNNVYCNDVADAVITLRGFPDELPRRALDGAVNAQTGGTGGQFYTSVASQAFSGDCAVNYKGSASFIPD